MPREQVVVNALGYKLKILQRKTVIERVMDKIRGLH
jgi:hypothetical protein